MKTTINGIDINYERAGTGRPVLLLHGWGASIEAMRPILNYVVHIGREAVALDFPGFGQSCEPMEPWGVTEYAALTRSFIQEQGLYGCDVICHSFGGRVTIMLAAENESIFGKLVMVDAAGVRPKRGFGYYFKTFTYKLGKRVAHCKLLDRCFKLSEKQKNAGSADYRALSGVMRATFVKVVNEDLTKKLDNIKNETLLVWGSDDHETPLYMAHIMEKRIKNAGLAVINGAGHFSYVDDYQRFCSIIKIILL
ncbi:MAG: alpha/beta hydrolase [Clostridia bacterium]